MGNCNSLDQYLPMLGGLPAMIAYGAGGFSYNKTVCDKSRSAFVSITSDIVAVSITKNMLITADILDSDQSIEITCSPSVDVFENNEVCRTCMQAVLDDYKYHEALERAMWKRHNARVRQPIDQTVKVMADGLQNCGLRYCKACVLIDVNQSSIIKGFKSDSNDATFKVGVTTDFNSILTTVLNNNQDALSAALKAFKFDNVQQLTNHITQKLLTTANIKNIYDTTMKSQSRQNVNIRTADGFVSGITHQSLYNAVLQSSLGIVENYMDSIQSKIDIISELVSQQNTLDEIGNLVFKSIFTFTDALNSSVGKVMISILIVLGITVLAVAVHMLYKIIPRLVHRTKTPEVQSNSAYDLF